MKEKVAIKEIDTSKLSQKRLNDLNIEMNVLSQLAHENIVRLFEVYMLNDKIYLVSVYRWLRTRSTHNSKIERERNGIYNEV